MNDLEFAQKCAAGDKRAWDEFVDKYSRLIYNYIHSVFNLKSQHRFSRENINDLFQEIFVSLAKDNFRKLKSFKAKNGCSLASWLRQVVINSTLDYIRNSRTLVSLDAETQDGSNLKEMLADGSPPVTQGLCDEERIRELKDCIGRLDNDDKFFLELHVNRGLRLAELGGILGISRGAVDMRKHKIIGRLRDCFKSKGFQLDFSS